MTIVNRGSRDNTGMQYQHFVARGVIVEHDRYLDDQGLAVRELPDIAGDEIDSAAGASVCVEELVGRFIHLVAEGAVDLLDQVGIVTPERDAVHSDGVGGADVSARVLGIAGWTRRLGRVERCRAVQQSEVAQRVDRLVDACFQRLGGRIVLGGDRGQELIDLLPARCAAQPRGRFGQHMGGP